MAANPRRVETAHVGAPTVRLTDHDGASRTVAVADLIRPELVRAATLAFPGINGRAWLRQPNDNIRRALTEAELPADLEAAPPPGHTPKRPKGQARKAPPVPTEANGHASDTHLAAAMLDLIRQVGGQPAEPTEAVRKAADQLTEAARLLADAAAILRGDPTCP